MTRLRALFVCVIAAVGIAALASAGASAAQPEFQECHKVKRTGAYSDSACSMTEPKHKGRYELGEVAHECVKAHKVDKHFTGRFTNKTCSEESGSHEGKFEAQRGVGRGHVFTGNAQSASLYVGNEFIDCKSGAKDRGLVTGPKTVSEVTLSLRGCAYGGEDPCGTPAAGEQIQTVALSGKLGYIDAATHEVGLDLAPEGGGSVVSEFTCDVASGTPVTVRGSVVMALTEDLNSVTPSFDLSSAGSSGSIPVERLEGGPTDILEWETSFGPEPMPVNVNFAGEGERLEVSG